MSMYSFLKCHNCGYKFTAREGTPHWISDFHELSPIQIGKEIEAGLHGDETKKILKAMEQPVSIWVEQALYACDFCKELYNRERIWLSSENGRYAKRQYNCKICKNPLRYIDSSKWNRVHCPKCFHQMIETEGGVQ